MHVDIHRTKIYGTLVFHFYLKHIKEPKSISDVTSTRSNPCSTPSGHSEGDMAYLCSQSAAIPHEVQHQVPGEIQGFPSFRICVYLH